MAPPNVQNMISQTEAFNLVNVSFTYKYTIVFVFSHIEIDTNEFYMLTSCRAGKIIGLYAAV